MSISRALSILGAGLGGYGQGQEQQRQRQRQEEDDAFRREQRDRQKKGWQREDEEYAEKQAQKQADLAAAAAPVPVAEATRPETMDNRDVGQPGEQSFGIRVGQQVVPTQAAADTAVQQAMTPQARMARVAAAQRDPMRAAQIQQQAGVAELQQAQLMSERDKQDHIKWRTEAAKSVVGTQGNLSTPEGIAAWMSQSKADGADGATKWTAKKEGANIVLTLLGPDGKPAGSRTIPDTLEGRLEFVAELDTRTPIEAKLADARAKKEAQSRQSDREADNARQAARDKADAEYRASMLAATRARAGGGGGGAGQGSGAQPGQAAVAWDDKADERLFAHYGKEDPTTGAKYRDGHGIDFSKQVALAISARNGGDTLRAVGMAIDIDTQLQARATAAAAASGGKLSPEAALRAERIAFLNARAPAMAQAPAGPAAPSAPQPRASMKDAAPRGPNALRAPPAQLTTAELRAVPPGHPAYEPSQQELRRRMAAEQADAQQIPPGLERGI